MQEFIKNFKVDIENYCYEQECKDCPLSQKMIFDTHGEGGIDGFLLKD